MWLKGEPLHLTSTNHPGSLTTTRGLAPSIHSHFLSAPRLHSSIAFLRLKTKGMERLEGEGELMPTPVCSWYHSVCVCVCHYCGAWLPSAGTPLTLQAQDISFLHCHHWKKFETTCFHESAMHKAVPHTLQVDMGRSHMSNVLPSSVIFCLSVVAWPLHSLVPPPPPLDPLNLSKSHASIFTPLAFRKKRWKSLG